MFGQPQQQYQQQQPGSSGTNSFGSWGSTANNATNTLWGQPATQPTTISVPSLGSSVFGNPTQQQLSQNTVFGGTTGGFGNTNAQQPSSQSSLFPGTFGVNNPQAQGQQSTTVGSFGNSPFATVPQSSTNIANASIFGTKPAFGSSFNQLGSSTVASTQPTSSPLWGNALASNNSAFNLPLPIASVQGSSQSSVSFTRNTRFNDLPDTVQKIFETIDAHIQGRIQISGALKSRSLIDEPTKAAEMLRRVHNELVNVVTSQQSDRSVVEEFRSKVDQCVQDTIITTRIIDGFKNPQQNGVFLKDHSTFPLEYFNAAAEEIRQKFLWYKSTIEQIERRLVSAQSQVQYTPQVISSTLQAQNTTFLALAAKTAKLDRDLQELKTQYRELWKAHTGSARDPFNELDRRPGDSEGLLNGVRSFNLGR